MVNFYSSLIVKESYIYICRKNSHQRCKQAKIVFLEQCKAKLCGSINVLVSVHHLALWRGKGNATN